MPERFHLGWHQSHLVQMLRGEGLWYVLVPEATGRDLDYFRVQVIAHTGRPEREPMSANQLQLMSVRNPEIAAGVCPREQAVLRRLLENALTAAYALETIVLTQSPPAWARYPPMALKHRDFLWRAGGAL